MNNQFIFQIQKIDCCNLQVNITSKVLIILDYFIELSTYKLVYMLVKKNTIFYQPDEIKHVI